MNDQLNVLSLDWDYFVGATAMERLMLFPDGGREDIGEILQDLIWSNHYTSGELSKIHTDISAVRRIKKLFRSAEFEPSTIYIADSHAHIYDVVQKATGGNLSRHINLLNVDFHHDVYNVSEDEVDCGNWCRFLMKEFGPDGNQFTWVKRSDSDDIYDTVRLLNKVTPLEITEDLNAIFEWNWDVVFVCRSAMWSPPHLDRSFRDTFNLLIKYQPEVYLEQGIFINRYNRIRKMSEQTRASLQQVAMFLS